MTNGKAALTLAALSHAEDINGGAGDMVYRYRVTICIFRYNVNGIHPRYPFVRNTAKHELP